MSSIQHKWSDQQLKIFEWFANPGKTRSLLVRARAGCSKTTSITEGFNHAPEERILYAVFNTRNKDEAKEKIKDPRVDIRTFHSLGFSCVKQFWRDAIPDASDGVEYDRIAQVIGKDAPNDVFNAVARLVGYAKSACVGLPEVSSLRDIADLKGFDARDFESEEAGGWTLLKIAQNARECMELSLTQDPARRISFGDMVWLPVTLDWVRPRYNLVAADETQDLSAPQIELAERSVIDQGRICFIGDDRQSIYLWRAAKHGSMDEFKARHKANELGLTRTFRCAKSIVKMASKIVPDFEAAPQNPEGVIEFMDREKMLSTLIPGNVVLSRVNAPLVGLCISLLKRGVTARIEGKDIGASLIGVVKRFHANSIEHYLQRLEGWKQSEMKRANAKSRFPEQKITEINEKAEMLEAVCEGCTTVQSIILRLESLFIDSNRDKKPAVIFSSVHKYKGLEADKVFLLESTFRLKFNGKNPKKPDPAQEFENQNIRYVAITRARNHLVLVDDPVVKTTAPPAPEQLQAAVPAPTPKPLPISVAFGPVTVEQVLGKK